MKPLFFGEETLLLGLCTPGFGLRCYAPGSVFWAVVPLSRFGGRAAFAPHFRQTSPLDRNMPPPGGKLAQGCSRQRALLFKLAFDHIAELGTAALEARANLVSRIPHPAPSKAVFCHPPFGGLRNKFAPTPRHIQSAPQSPSAASLR